MWSVTRLAMALVAVSLNGFGFKKKNSHTCVFLCSFWGGKLSFLPHMKNLIHVAECLCCPALRWKQKAREGILHQVTGCGGNRRQVGGTPVAGLQELDCLAKTTVVVAAKREADQQGESEH